MKVETYKMPSGRISRLVKTRLGRVESDIIRANKSKDTVTVKTRLGRVESSKGGPPPSEPPHHRLKPD